MMTRQLRRRIQFGVASLLVLQVVLAIAFAIRRSSEDLEGSLRRDLDIAKTAEVEIVDEGIRRSPLQSDERYAWILVETGSKIELMGAVRPVDESMPWRIPIVMISWIDDQVGPEPFYFVFNSRPTKTEIDDSIRYSEEFW